MSDFMDTAKAVEPVIRMLNEGGCRHASAVIFEDGSGSILVGYASNDRATTLLVAHGVRLEGYRSNQNRADYKFSIDRAAALKNYTESLCPHCGKDTEVSAEGVY